MTNISNDGGVWVMITPIAPSQHRPNPTPWNLDLEIFSEQPQFSEDILRAVVVHDAHIFEGNIDGGDSIDITQRYWDHYRNGPTSS